MKPAQNPRRQSSPRQYIRALDLAAQRSTVAAIAVGFRRITQLVFAHNPARAVILGRLISAGGVPFGVVGHHNSDFHAQPYHQPFPDWAANEAAQAHLGLLSRSLLQGFSICYASLPVPPSDRAPWTRSPAELIPELERHAATLARAAITVALDTGPDLVFPHEPDWPTTLAHLVESDGTPIGVIGYLHPSNGQGCQAAARPFPEYAQIPWVQDYLAALCDRLQEHRNASASKERRECPTHTQLEFGFQAVKDALTYGRP